MQRPVRDRADAKASTRAPTPTTRSSGCSRTSRDNNGRVGMLGISYAGWLTTMALLDPHPALKAASEQASPADMFLGDDFHHNGAFRLSYGFEYAALMEIGQRQQHQLRLRPARTPTTGICSLGALSNVNAKYFHGKIPTWNDFVAHPNYDRFWKKQAFAPYIKTAPTVPNLNVAGWWDQEDFYGPMKIYELLEKNDTEHLNFSSPARGTTAAGGARTGSKLGEIPFGSNTCKHFPPEIEAPWFAYWLKDKGTRQVRRKRSCSRRARNRGSAMTPGRRAMRKATNHLFPANGKLSFDGPAGADAGRLRQLPLRPRASRSLSPAADQPDLSRGRLVHLAGRGSTLRRPPARRADLGDGAAHRGVNDRRQHRGRVFRLHHRQRRRLGREADRRLPGIHPADGSWPGSN